MSFVTDDVRANRDYFAHKLRKNKGMTCSSALDRVDNVPSAGANNAGEEFLTAKAEIEAKYKTSIQ
jgi:hypothetical protein